MSEDNPLAKREGDGEIEQRDARPAISLDISKLSPDSAAIVVSRVSQYAKAFRDVAYRVSDAPETTEYVLRIGRKVQEGLDSGDLKLMTKQSGEILASVVGKSDKSNRTVIKQALTAEERTVKSITAAQQAETISSDLYNIAVQQQMAEITAQLADVLRTAQRIEQGQQEDRFALIDAAESQLRLAAVAEDETNRLDHIKSAQAFLQEGVAKISRALVMRVQSVDAIPSFPPAIFWKMLTTKDNYYDKMSEWYGKAMEDQEVIEKAYALLALCAVAIDEPNMLDVLMDDYANKLRAVDTEKLLSMGNINPGEDYSGEWFSDVKGYIDQRREQTRLLTDGDYIDVTITGKMLMEAIEDEPGEDAEEPVEDSE